MIELALMFHKSPSEIRSWPLRDIQDVIAFLSLRAEREERAAQRAQNKNPRRR